MISLTSSIEGVQVSFQELTEILYPEGFTLGSGYTYDHGYLDKPLDWAETHGYRYYLRIPVASQSGDLDRNETILKLGQPFIVKHEFLTKKNDLTADIGVISAAVNQFTKPINDPDDPINEKWITRGKEILEMVEQKLQN